MDEDEDEEEEEEEEEEAEGGRRQGRKSTSRGFLQQCNVHIHTS